MKVAIEGLISRGLETFVRDIEHSLQLNITKFKTLSIYVYLGICECMYFVTLWICFLCLCVFACVLVWKNYVSKSFHLFLSSPLNLFLFFILLFIAIKTDKIIFRKAYFRYKKMSFEVENSFSV